MLKILVTGISGRMGHLIIALVLWYVIGHIL